MAVQLPSAMPSAAMVATIVTKSSLLLSQSHLNSPPSKLGTPTKKSWCTIPPRLPQGKNRLVDGKGGVHQTTYSSLFCCVRQSSCPLQRVTNCCYLHISLKIKTFTLMFTVKPVKAKVIQTRMQLKQQLSK